MIINNLQSKVALITGAGSGIGRATALAFARYGAKVVVVDIGDQAGQETATLIKAEGGEASFIQADVSNAAQVKDMVAATVERYGRLDCAHNNAGVSGTVGIKLADCAETEWDQVIETNLKGVWLCMKYEILQMIEQGGGAIVNTASIAGISGANSLPIYCVSKFGVVGLTRTAARQYAPQGIRVNAICPGAIETPMLDYANEIMPQFKAASVQATPLGRLGAPDEVAQTVVWLSSDAASYITGVAVPVDGGWVA
jgi:NAD(P)-dependent dehydrogenase (short-subunit alcohol dehydrogenase family)